MSKNILIALVILGVVLFAGFGVYAKNQNMHNDLITKIAKKFNLKETDVTAVFDEVRKEHQAQRQAQINENLTKAVKDGKITEAQKQAILKKHEEMKNNRQNMQSWMEKNGFNMQTMHEITGFGRGFGRMGMGF